MARKPATRSVRCYLCDHVFEIPREAITTSCPSCNKRVVIEDIVVRHAQGNTVLGTCGRLIVQPRASVVARRIRAIEGVEVDGTIESAVETEGAVHLGAGARWKGDCRARVLVIEPGASILGGFFSIGAGASDGRVAAAPQGGEASRGSEDGVAASSPSIQGAKARATPADGMGTGAAPARRATVRRPKADEPEK